MVLVLLLACVKRFRVYRMHDFFFLLLVFLVRRVFSVECAVQKFSVQSVQCRVYNAECAV